MDKYVEFINDMLSESSTQNEILEREYLSRRDYKNIENNRLKETYYYIDYQEDNW